MYVPVFSGRTELDEKVVLYKEDRDESKLHILRPDGELWALSPGSTVETRFELDAEVLLLFVDSPEWTGSAKGSHFDLLEEQPIFKEAL